MCVACVPCSHVQCSIFLPLVTHVTHCALAAGCSYMNIGYILQFRLKNRNAFGVRAALAQRCRLFNLQIRSSSSLTVLSSHVNLLTSAVQAAQAKLGDSFQQDVELLLALSRCLEVLSRLSELLVRDKH